MTGRSASARDTFLKVVKGKNFMTPGLIRFGWAGPYAYELSPGEFMNKPLYGVTVVDSRTMTSDHDKSTCFPTLEEAEAYIKTLAD